MSSKPIKEIIYHAKLKLSSNRVSGMLNLDGSNQILTSRVLKITPNLTDEHRNLILIETVNSIYRAHSITIIP